MLNSIAWFCKNGWNMLETFETTSILRCGILSTVNVSESPCQVPLVALVPLVQVPGTRVPLLLLPVWHLKAKYKNAATAVRTQWSQLGTLKNQGETTTGPLQMTSKIKQSPSCSELFENQSNINWVIPHWHLGVEMSWMLDKPRLFIFCLASGSSSDLGHVSFFRASLHASLFTLNASIDVSPTARDHHA